MIVDTTGDEPRETTVSIPTSLGAVGYAAFALVQPIPLDEIVPFQMLMTAYEAEAAALTAPSAPLAPLAPAAAPVAASTSEAAPEPAEVPEPVYNAGGYRPAPVSESWSRGLQDRVAGYGGRPPQVEVTEPETTEPEPTERADDSMLREMAALGLGNEPSDQPAQPEQPDQPGEEVPVDKPLPARGYAANPASVDSRARQVLDELSFLFDGK